MHHKQVGRSLVDVVEGGGSLDQERQQNLVAHVNFVESGKIERETVGDWLFFYLKEMDKVDVKYWKLNECYDRYKEEGWQSILPMIEAHWGIGMTETVDEGNECEACRKNLILKPYIIKGNNHQVEWPIFWEFGKVALVLHRIIWKSEGEQYTIPASWDYLSLIKLNPTFRLTPTIMLGHALINTSRLMPYRLYQGHSKYKWYLTTKCGLYGAVAIFYPNMQERLAERLGGDYYVDFYNMHRLLLCPVHRCKNLTSCAASGSSEQFLQGQPGYGRLYRYFQDRGKLVEV
jgi:hypothetical protein